MMMSRKLVDGLASVQLAVAVMVALAGVCTAATVYESRFGTPAAQQAFYSTWWFALLLAVLAVNVFLSMAKRWPFTVHHAGFVMAHVGILLLLGGSLVTLQFGIDGSLSLREGDAGAEVALPARSLQVELDGRRLAVPVVHDGEFWGEERHPVADDVAVVITRHQPHVDYHEHLEDGPGGVPMIEYHFEGTGFERQPGQLLADDPAQGRAEFGPVMLVFLTATPEHPADALLEPPTDQPHAIFVADGERLRYALSSRKAPVVRGEVEIGRPIDTPWMELQLVVDKLRPSVKRERHIAAQRVPADGGRRPALEVRLDKGEQKGEPQWVAWGETREVGVAGVAAQVGYSDASVPLPFKVTLLDFNSDKYPGSTMAATYESRVRIEDPEQGVFERVIAMNRPLHHRGYTLFQSSFAEGERMVSVFSVSRAPGLPVVYLGTTLLVLGVAWMFYGKPWLARRQGQRALAMRLATLLLLGLAAAPASAADDTWAEIRRLPVQDAGRVKPLDTFARETARRVTGARAFGSDSVKGLDPVAWMVSAWADPQRWSAEPIVRVADASLRSFVQLPPDRDRYSFDDLVGHEPFIRIAEEARRKQQMEEALSPEEQSVLGLYGNLTLFSAVLAREAPLVYAVPGSDWVSLHKLEGAPDREAQAAVSAWKALAAATTSGDAASVRSTSVALREKLQGGPVDAALATRLDREVKLNALKPFRASTLAYMLALLALFASLPLQSRWLGRLGMAALVGGFLMQTWGFVLRTLVAERAPVANMYESIVFAAWGAVAFALVYELRHHTRLFGACAASVAVPFLLIADNVPIFDAAIDPLAPVLRDNFWLTTHVLTITLGYAALFLALAMAHVSLLFIWRASGEAKLKTLSGFIYRVLQAGTLLLAAGTLLGGVWASYSWGRFWGWDPKETWALIALLVYLAILHARFVGWLKDFGLAVGSIAGGLSVLMAWYGVNYVLGTGLHSYGFGSGGANGWVAGYAAAEILLIAAVAWRRRPAPMAGATLPTAVAAR